MSKLNLNKVSGGAGNITFKDYVAKDSENMKDNSEYNNPLWEICDSAGGCGGNITPHKVSF